MKLGFLNSFPLHSPDLSRPWLCTEQAAQDRLRCWQLFMRFQQHIGQFWDFLGLGADTCIDQPSLELSCYSHSVPRLGIKTALSASGNLLQLQKRLIGSHFAHILGSASVSKNVKLLCHQTRVNTSIVWVIDNFFSWHGMSCSLWWSKIPNEKSWYFDSYSF